MAYIYKKLIHGKPYYYLRISKRVKGKVVVKDIAYLGSDPLKINKKINNIPKQYSDEIRKAYRNIKKFIEEEYYLQKVLKKKLKKNDYFAENELEAVEAAKLHFNTNFLKKDVNTIQETYRNFLIDFAYNSTSIEGNTITLPEASDLLIENIVPKNKNLREIYDLKNTEKVFNKLLNLRKKISHRLIIEFHDELMENIDLRKGYRTHDIRVFKSRFKTTPFPYIKADMDIILKWYSNNQRKLHPLVTAAIFHQKFEKIHPFSDGNGRTGRMIFLYMLMRNKFPPIIIRKSRRNEYLKSMSLGDKADLLNVDIKHYKGLVSFCAKELIDNYWNNFNV